MSNEMFYRDKNGEKRDDRMHEELLNNVEADKSLARDAIERAMQGGISYDLAYKLYGQGVLEREAKP